MKKIFVLLLALLMLFCCVGCQGNTGPAKESISGNTQEEDIDGYIKAEYEKYNSPASENGLGGILLYDDVLITEVQLLDTGIYIFVENKDNNPYVIAVGTYPVWSPANLYDYVGKNVRIFFEYVGFSGVNQMPFGQIINIGKMELETGETVTSSNFLASAEEFRNWVADNGVQLHVNDPYPDTQPAYVMITGLAVDVSHYSRGTVYFDLYEAIDDAFKYKLICADYDECFGASSISEGEGVIVYGYINSDAFTPVYIESFDVEFTIEDVVDNYKSCCEEFDYTSIARDPELYKGKFAKFSGKVVQVIEDGLSVTLRVNVTKNAYSYEDTMYVTYTRKDSSESRILEGDIITMYGVLRGLETYTTVLGGSVTIPKMSAEYIEIN